MLSMTLELLEVSKLRMLEKYAEMQHIWPYGAPLRTTVTCCTLLESCRRADVKL